MDRKYNCTVPSCTTRRENGFVTIPRFGSSLAQQRIKNLWIERLQLREPSKFAKICTDHFLHEDFTKNLKRYNGRLKEGVIPSVKLPPIQDQEIKKHYSHDHRKPAKVSRICSCVLSFRLRSTKLGMNMDLPKGFQMTAWNPTSASKRPHQRPKHEKNGPSIRGAGAKASWPLKTIYGPKVA